MVVPAVSLIAIQSHHILGQNVKTVQPNVVCPKPPCLPINSHIYDSHPVGVQSSYGKIYITRGGLAGEIWVQLGGTNFKFPTRINLVGVIYQYNTIQYLEGGFWVLSLDCISDGTFCHSPTQSQHNLNLSCSWVRQNDLANCPHCRN